MPSSRTARPLPDAGVHAEVDGQERKGPGKGRADADEAGEAVYNAPARLNSNDDMIIIDAIIHLRNQNARVMQEESDVMRADSAAGCGALLSSDSGDLNVRLCAGGVGALLPRGSRASANGSAAAALRNTNVSVAPVPALAPDDKNAMRKQDRTSAGQTKREAEGTALALACPHDSLTKRT